MLDGQYSPAELENPTVGKRFSTILDRALAHDAKDRYASANEMREALAAELKRVGVESPARELEAYFDDPEGYAKEHARRTITKLCDLAQTARKEDRALDAAADYNRALAYAPDDPQLLRIVARMQQAAARTRMLKRAWPLVLVTIAAMVGAYFLTQSLKHGRAQSLASDVPTTSAAASGSARVSASAPDSVSIPASVSVPIIATTTASGPVVHSERVITFANVEPASVELAIDNVPADPVNKSSGDTIKIDDREHSLRFTCAGDACEPLTKKILAGKKDDSISIELKIKDAKLLVTLDASVSHGANPTFGIVEYPTMSVVPGVPASFIMSRASNLHVTLVDRANPSRKQRVDLHAGQQVSAMF